MAANSEGVPEDGDIKVYVTTQRNLLTAGRIYLSCRVRDSVSHVYK